MKETRSATRALMACLGNPSRFRLVQALIGQARCVSDLAAEVGLSQSCTTRHLQALERWNVVRGARDGKRVLYRIQEDRGDLMPLIGWAMEARAAGLSAALARPTRGAGPNATPVAPYSNTPSNIGRPAAPGNGVAAGATPGASATAAARASGGAGDSRRLEAARPASVTTAAAEPDPAPETRRRRVSEIEDFLL